MVDESEHAETNLHHAVDAQTHCGIAVRQRPNYAVRPIATAQRFPLPRSPDFRLYRK